MLDTIQFFKNKISTCHTEDIDEFLKEKKYDLKEEVAIKSDYYLNTNHEYEVLLPDRGKRLQPDRSETHGPYRIEAETIARNWASRRARISIPYCLRSFSKYSSIVFS